MGRTDNRRALPCSCWMVRRVASQVSRCGMKTEQYSPPPPSAQGRGRSSRACTTGGPPRRIRGIWTPEVPRTRISRAGREPTVAKYELRDSFGARGAAVGRRPRRLDGRPRTSAPRASRHHHREDIRGSSASAATRAPTRRCAATYGEVEGPSARGGYLELSGRREPPSATSAARCPGAARDMSRSPFNARFCTATFSSARVQRQAAPHLRWIGRAPALLVLDNARAGRIAPGGGSPPCSIRATTDTQRIQELGGERASAAQPSVGSLDELNSMLRPARPRLHLPRAGRPEAPPSRWFPASEVGLLARLRAVCGNRYWRCRPGNRSGRWRSRVEVLDRRAPALPRGVVKTPRSYRRSSKAQARPRDIVRSSGHSRRSRRLAADSTPPVLIGALATCSPAGSPGGASGRPARAMRDAGYAGLSPAVLNQCSPSGPAARHAGLLEVEAERRFCAGLPAPRPSTATTGRVMAAARGDPPDARQPYPDRRRRHQDPHGLGAVRHVLRGRSGEVLHCRLLPVDAAPAANRPARPRSSPSGRPGRGRARIPPARRRGRFAFSSRWSSRRSRGLHHLARDSSVPDQMAAAVIDRRPPRRSCASGASPRAARPHTGRCSPTPKSDRVDKTHCWRSNPGASLPTQHRPEAACSPPGRG